jgi:hypothetical protein
VSLHRRDLNGSSDSGLLTDLVPQFAVRATSPSRAERGRLRRPTVGPRPLATSSSSPTEARGLGAPPRRHTCLAHACRAERAVGRRGQHRAAHSAWDRFRGARARPGAGTRHAQAGTQALLRAISTASRATPIHTALESRRVRSRGGAVTCSCRSCRPTPAETSRLFTEKRRLHAIVARAGWKQPLFREATKPRRRSTGCRLGGDVLDAREAA